MSSGPEHQPPDSSEQLRRNEWDAHAETRARIKEGFACFDPDAFEEYLKLPDVELIDPK